VANPQRQKGTTFETFVVNEGKDYDLDISRMPASSRYDINVRGNTGRVIEALVAREDYGSPLVTIPLRDYFHLLQEHGDSSHIECKRLKRIALHGIYEGKFNARRH
jgi:hypothetical protein